MPSPSDQVPKVPADKISNCAILRHLSPDAPILSLPHLSTICLQFDYNLTPNNETLVTKLLKKSCSVSNESYLGSVLCTMIRNN